MSADLLREAAALMRERAGRMPEGRYGMESKWTTASTMLSKVTSGDRAIAETRQGAEPYDGVYVADYFASWHPAVALAVADLLDNEASLLNGAKQYPDLHNPLNAARTDLLLTVARAYLGRQS